MIIGIWKEGRESDVQKKAKRYHGTNFSIVVRSRINVYIWLLNTNDRDGEKIESVFVPGAG